MPHSKIPVNCKTGRFQFDKLVENYSTLATCLFPPVVGDLSITHFKAKTNQKTFLTITHQKREKAGKTSTRTHTHTMTTLTDNKMTLRQKKTWNRQINPTSPLALIIQTFQYYLNDNTCIFLISFVEQAILQTNLALVLNQTRCAQA